MRISVLALDDLWATGLTLTLDAFALANSLSARKMGGSPYFDVSVVGVCKEGPIWPRNAHTSQCDHAEIEARLGYCSGAQYGGAGPIASSSGTTRRETG